MTSLSVDDLLTKVVEVDGQTTWRFVGADADLAIRYVSGKGVGIFALRRFHRGERIACERPLVAWESALNASGHHDWSELESLVDALDEDERRDFWSLCDKTAQLDGGDRKSACGIWNSNSFPTEDVLADGRAAATDGRTYSAVYRLCSRVNHECRPSCYAAWSAPLGKQTVHALREIAPGEELSFAYVGGAEAGPRAHRQRALASKYRFECACELCKWSGDELMRSEARQARIAAIHCLYSAGSSDGVDDGGGSDGGSAGSSGGSDGSGGCCGGCCSGRSSGGHGRSGRLEALVEEHLELMGQEGLPLLWARAGILLTIVALKAEGHHARAYPHRGAPTSGRAHQPTHPHRHER